jgi:ribosomal protein L11 methyltransferase
VTQKEWHAAEVRTTGANREAIEYGLIEAGALGTETVESHGQTQITGYFAAPVDEPRLRNALQDALRIYSCQTDKAFQLNVSVFADRDWLAEWKANWRPVAVGRFLIAPPWLVSEPGAAATGPLIDSASSGRVATAPGSDTILIQINPGMAFGTGTHETTRLCLKAIEKHFRGGSFLDVGTGTGILAIAAAKMCQQPSPSCKLVACDTDADAIEIAKENAGLNSVPDRIDFRVGSIDASTESADLVCANLTAPVIVDLLPALLGATCGRLVLSGILDSQIEMIKARLLELAVVDFEIHQDGEWVALII